jgi:SAM-dependent methyltransferase
MRSTLSKTVESAIFAPEYESEAYVEEYLKVHMRRFVETTSLLKNVVHADMRVIDVGSYGSLVPVLKDLLGVRRITITGPRQPDRPQSEESTLSNSRYGHRYPLRVDRFDLEGPFPYENETFDLVIFTEVLEHIPRDPAHVLSEINRITKSEGWLLLSTPNCASAQSFLNILRGKNPNIYPIYTKQPSYDRHNREYVPWEIGELLRACGYQMTHLKTVDVYNPLTLATLTVKTALWLGSLLSLNRIRPCHRGDTIFALAKKVSIPIERYPAFLYV